MMERFLFLFSLSLAIWAQRLPTTGVLTLPCSDTSGSATAQSCSTSPSYTIAATNCVNYTTTTQNSGDLTVAVNGGSAAHVRKWLGASVLASGDMPANETVLMCFDGTYWEPSTIGNTPVALQSSTPGTAQTGSSNITGSSLAGAFTAVSDGVHAGIDAVVGNTTVPALPSNSFAWIGPNSASFTTWVIQPTSTGPSASCLMTLGPVASNVSAETCIATAGTGAAIPTGPASSTSGDLVSYTGTTGQQQDSGIASSIVATLTGTQTLTNKTLTSPVLNGSSGNSPMTITAANCLAATTINTPCIAWQGAATGLNNTGTSGTVTLYTSSAPANGVFMFCPNILIDNAGGSGGTLTLQVAFTTPASYSSSNYGLLSISTTSSYTGDFSCATIMTGSGSSLSFDIAALSVTGGPVSWEYNGVAMRLR
jgi:hypothetical protein